MNNDNKNNQDGYVNMTTVIHMIDILFVHGYTVKKFLVKISIIFEEKLRFFLKKSGSSRTIRLKSTRD